MFEKGNLYNHNTPKESEIDYKKKRKSVIFSLITEGRAEQNPENREAFRNRLRERIREEVIDRTFLDELAENFQTGNIAPDDFLSVEKIVDLLIPKIEGPETKEDDGPEPDNNQKNERERERENVGNIIRVRDTILPTAFEGPAIIHGPGEFEPKMFFPRTRILKEILEENGIDEDRYLQIIGRNQPEMMREISYQMFLIPDLEKMVFVCDEEGNATFVIHGISQEPEIFYSMTKDQLGFLLENGLASKICWADDREKWKQLVATELFKGSFLKIKGGSPNDFILRLLNHLPETINQREKKFAPYEEAVELVKKLNIKETGEKAEKEYERRYKEIPGLPSNPNHTYRNKGWIGWPEFLSKERLRAKREISIASYEKAVELVKNLAITATGNEAVREYEKKCEELPELPKNPRKTYKGKGWIGWPEFIGQKRQIEKREVPIVTYEEAIELANKLNIKSRGNKAQREYQKKYKETPGLPCSPNEIYKDKGWIGWPEFLGQKRIKEKRELPIIPYEEAIELVKKLNITATGEGSHREYKKRYKEMPGLPSNPRQSYKNKGWIGWPEFMGTKRKTEVQIVSYGEAVESVKKLSIRANGANDKIKEYKLRYKEIPGLPSHPEEIYKNKGWIGWPEFLGMDRRRKK